jgi:hypothetical protein
MDLKEKYQPSEPEVYPLSFSGYYSIFVKTVPYIPEVSWGVVERKKIQG